MQEFYTLKSGVISEFIGKLNKLKNSISDLEYINIKDHLKELRVFFNSNIKRFGHYICDSFYPSEILKGFSKLTIISGEISQDYSELTGSIENYYKNTTFNKKLTIVSVFHWPYL